jgi:TonB family protein
MALPSFDPARKFDPDRPQDDWTQMRARLSVAKNDSRKHETGAHSGRLIIGCIVFVVVALTLVGIASRGRNRLYGWWNDLARVAQEYTSPESAREQVSKKTAEKRNSKEHSAKKTATQKPALPLDEPSRSAAPPQMSPFAEVIDTTNRHYLVRYRPSPVVPLPGEQLPPDGVKAAGGTSTQATPLPRNATSFDSAGHVTTVNLRAYAPGSAGVVVLQGLVGEDGRVKDMQIVSGPPELAAPAAEAARRWRYVPEYYNGRPRERLVQITVDFTVLLNQ